MTKAACPTHRIPIELAILLLAMVVFPLDHVIAIGKGPTMQDARGISLSQILTGVLVGVVAWQALWRRALEPLRLAFRNPVAVLMLCFIGVMTLSGVVSRSPENAWGQILQRCSVFVLYVVVIHVIRNRRHMRLCVWGLVASIALSGTAGCYEMVTGQAVIEQSRYSDAIVRTGLHTAETGRVRIQGLEPEPDVHSGQLLLQMGLLMYLLFRPGSWKVKIIPMLLMVIASANIIATSARAAWLGMFVIVFVFLVAAPLRYKALMLGGAAGAIAVGFLLIIICFPQLAVLDRILGTQGAGNWSTTFRAEMLRASWEMGSHRPVLGVGTGNFRAEYPRAVRESPFLPRRAIPSPQHIYAAVFAENGLIGLTVYGLMHLAVLAQLIRSIRCASDLDEKMLAAGLLSAFVGFVYCLNFYPMWGSKYAWTVIALIWSQTLLRRRGGPGNGIVALALPPIHTR